MHLQFHKLLVSLLITSFVVVWTKFLSHVQPGSSNEFGRAGDSKNPILNSTLGFQEIYAIALPDRADRVIPLLDAANASNISVTILDAVRDRQIPEESWPKDWNPEQHKVGEVGCFTSHVRAWKKIVAERISSAVIMESDADWDLRIKEIMVGVGEGVERLIDWPFKNPQDSSADRVQHPSPYGDKWDIIWMGHCAAHDYGNGRIYEVFDPAVPPEEYEYSFGGRPNEDQHKPGTRIMFQLRGVICAYAYAITYQGAAKALKHFEEGTNKNLDFALRDLCNEKADIACAGVWPQVVSAAAIKSNIAHGDGEISSYSNDASPGPALQYSARVNSQRVLEGAGRAEWKPQWNSTWAMKDGNWSIVSFEEAKAITELKGRRT